MFSSRISLFLLLLLFSCKGSAKEPAVLHGKVVGVKDGDTIELLKDDNSTEVVRLFGIDCPEHSQAFGKAAKAATSDLCFGHEVRVLCQPMRDRYKRIVGTVYIGAINLNEQLLRRGLAWHYTRYDHSMQWDKMQDSARSAGIGLWPEQDPQAPWEWRAAKRKRH